MLLYSVLQYTLRTPFQAPLWPGMNHKERETTGVLPNMEVNQHGESLHQSGVWTDRCSNIQCSGDVHTSPEHSPIHTGLLRHSAMNASSFCVCSLHCSHWGETKQNSVVMFLLVNYCWAISCWHADDTEGASVQRWVKRNVCVLANTCETFWSMWKIEQPPLHVKHSSHSDPVPHR